MKTLEELSHDSFYNMDKYSQITIDYIEDLEDLLSKDIFEDHRKLELEAMSYDISNIIEIISPELETDVNAFFSLSEIINKYLENV